MSRLQKDFLEKLGSANRFDLLLSKSMGVYFFVKDTAGRVVMANQLTVERCGFSTENELIGKTDYDLFEFDLADKYQTPVVFLSDLDLGMNTWITDPLQEPVNDFDRGKIATDEVLQRLKNWGRYRDVDGDGIPYRTIPGVTLHPEVAHLTRGSGHDEDANYSESPEVYSANLDRLARKIDGMVADLPEPIREDRDTSLGVIAFGTTDWAVQEALGGIQSPPSYLRIRSYPFHAEVGSFISDHERILVIEQNQQGQMAQLLKINHSQDAGKIASSRYYGGLPLSARFVQDSIEEQQGVEV